jgi:hypothetical protein
VAGIEKWLAIVKENSMTDALISRQWLSVVT